MDAYRKSYLNASRTLLTNESLRNYLETTTDRLVDRQRFFIDGISPASKLRKRCALTDKLKPSTLSFVNGMQIINASVVVSQLSNNTTVSYFCFFRNASSRDNFSNKFFIRDCVVCKKNIVDDLASANALRWQNPKSTETLATISIRLTRA